MSRVFWDTNLFVYLFEENAEFVQMTSDLRTRMVERGDELITSAMTLAEVQVAPRRQNNLALAQTYRRVLPQIAKILPFNEAAADVYAQIRENAAISPPDAIQLSCAAAYGVELFVTNDKQLHKLTIPGIHFISLLTRVPI